MASDAVLKYLVDTNRPYSCADVTVNLRGAFPKSGIQKALDALSEAGKIKCKLYGKQKVYAALQTEDLGNDGDIEDFDGQLKKLTAEFEERTSKLKTIENKLKVITSKPTTEMAKTRIVEIENRMVTLEQKLNTLRTSTEVISAADKKVIMDGHGRLSREYRKRKRICSNMLEAVMEGYPKSKKTFIEELCIETDEMVDFKLMT